MPNTFMAVAMDLGDFKSPFGAIHPRDKQDVSSRLVLGALNVAYGQHVNPQGPYPVSAVRTSDGHVVVTYSNNQLLNVTENGNFEVGRITSFLMQRTCRLLSAIERLTGYQITKQFCFDRTRWEGGGQ